MVRAAYLLVHPAPWPLHMLSLARVIFLSFPFVFTSQDSLANVFLCHVVLIEVLHSPFCATQVYLRPHILLYFFSSLIAHSSVADFTKSTRWKFLGDIIIWSCFRLVLCEQIGAVATGILCYSTQGISKSVFPPKEECSHLVNVNSCYMANEWLWLKGVFSGPVAGKLKTCKRKTLGRLKLPPEPALGLLPSLPRLSPTLALNVYP